jgi:hypothetical protein
LLPQANSAWTRGDRLFRLRQLRKKTFLSLVFGRLRPKTKEKDVLFHPAGGESGLDAGRPPFSPAAARRTVSMSFDFSA